jgi:formylglycine-generating enzyme required for sulfatase activity
MGLFFHLIQSSRYKTTTEHSMNGKIGIALLAMATFFLCRTIVAETAPDMQFTNSIGMEFVLVPAGSFQVVIGKNEFAEDVFSTAIISKPFYLGKYPVTQEQWVAVMESNPSFFKGRRNPVEKVSWNDAQEFIRRLNTKEGHERYRLPTEMEWEYAAKGGTNTKYFFMKDPKTWAEAEGLLADYAWSRGNARETTHPVGQKKPNPYGFYDIYGNVFEWVQDWYAELPKSQKMTDYRGPKTGDVRVNRGGSWFYTAKLCRSDHRDYDKPDFRDTDLGFRLALSSE